MSMDDVNAMLSGVGAKAFPFEAIGDSVTGTILEAKVVQQTDMETGAPQFWRDGSPKTMIRVMLQTELQDDEADDGIRNVYLRGGNYTIAKGTGTSSLIAVRDAAKKATGKANMEAGAKLRLTHSGLGQSSQRGFNQPKLYEAAYQPPATNVDLEELF